MPVPSPPTIVQDSTATPCALPLGDWVAAAFAERQAWRRVAGELKACGPGHAWNLRDLARLDHVGAQILWNHWGRAWPGQIELSDTQRQMLERVAQFSTPCAAPAPWRLSTQIDRLGELVLHVAGDIATPLPCTPRGILALLARYDIELGGKDVCVLGRGITIGRTIPLLLTRRGVDATVTLCHTGTEDVQSHLRRADVIVSATGQPGFVGPDDVKPGAVLVDVGIARVFDEESGRYRIKGDIDRDCYETAGAYTPNPGGVGPMTRAMLLTNVVEMAERRVSRHTA